MYVYLSNKALTAALTEPLNKEMKKKNTSLLVHGNLSYTSCKYTQSVQYQPVLLSQFMMFFLKWRSSQIVPERANEVSNC